ncbi:MAG: iron ABC transporter permease, partial [Oxalobacteraceae bacterium]|nr:iron ABC transporter permease [Oxalobacteraceae bacterium]
MTSGSQRAWLILLSMAALAALALGAAVACGSTGCFAGSADIVWALRLPRALSA